MTKIKSVLPVLVMILGLLVPGLAARAADLVVPDPSIAPEEVVAIQMRRCSSMTIQARTSASRRHGASRIRAIVR